MTEPWTEWYFKYGVGRATELGFAAKPWQLWTGQFPIGMINDSGLPSFVEQYIWSPEQRDPATGASLGFYPTWAAMFAGFDPAYLDGSCGASCSGGEASLPVRFAGGNAPSGRHVWLTPGLAMLVDAGAPGAPAAWNWWQTNVYSIVLAHGGFGAYPNWAIVPRTDANVLPAQPTAPP